MRGCTLEDVIKKQIEEMWQEGGWENKDCILAESNVKENIIL